MVHRSGMAKRRHEVRVDRISGMPQPIQQQILSLLSQAEAVKTCVLSKSWSHHWCTRPNVEFLEDSFKGKQQTFESVVDKTLQRYHDQNLSIHEFRLQLSKNDSKPSAELLSKWIPKLKIFNINLLREVSWDNFKFDIPSAVFKAKSLQKLYLRDCTLDKKKCAVSVLCKYLKTLHLEKVNIADETLKKIISTCPLLESVTFNFCSGLSAIEVDDNKLHNLKHFECTTTYGFGMSPSIEIHVPSAVIERIKISCCDIWFHSNSKRNLTSLSLKRVRLSSEMFDFFSSNNMPSLEFLELVSCYGFKEFHLASRSIKHLSFDIQRMPMVEPVIRATIDAPNILCFKFSSYLLPSVFSFATTNSSSHEWKSELWLNCYHSLRFQELHEMLKELSGSKISLKLSHTLSPKWEITGDEPCSDKKPVVVEYLKLWLDDHSMASRSAFLNELFNICRPRILVEDENTGDFLSEFFEMDTGYLWEQDLEEVSKGTYGTDGYFYRDRFRLKWREK